MNSLNNIIIKKPQKLILLVSFMGLFACHGNSQEHNPDLINKKTIGVLGEFGIPYYTLPEGDHYIPVLFGITFETPIYKTSNFFNLSVELYPHVGYVFWGAQNCFEAGLNVRLSFNFAVSAKDLLRFKIGSGPHYINVQTEKQVSGFIFSDYWLGCYNREIMIKEKEYTINFEFGYRHMSNAGTKFPNRSISNMIVGVGISKIL